MNSDVIRLLPDSVANQIAAGEVIQRPASVIKELVENSVDAGADSITIVLRDAGRTLIQVVDNGCGMSPTDARMAFERHATSKIASADDLYTLHTMGFRGEALPSIAAVAQIDLRTMRAGESVGTRLTLNESRFEAQEPCACSPGTNICVKNLFFHMPARRKFLKKDSVELGHILREFERLALVNTGVDFTLIHNDVTMHQLLRGTLKQRIGGLFGKTLESQLAPLGTETSIVRLTGFIGMPRFAKRRGAPQFLFVNGRYMRHPVFHKVVMRCYEPLIAADTQPAYFIDFSVDPSTIDVNIHPQKYEIKFEHEQAICQILEAAIRETLGKTQAAGALDFDSESQPDIPLFAPDADVPVPADGSDYGTVGSDGGALSVRGLRAASWDRPSGASTRGDWEKLYENFSRKRNESLEGLRPSSINGDGSGVFENVATLPNSEAEWGGTCIQLPGGYIGVRCRSGLMLVHQQRAHIRILFECMMRQAGEGMLPSQKLIFAEDLELPPEQGALLAGLQDQMRELGFEVTHNGNLSWTITAMPAVLSGISPGEALQDLLSSLPEGADGRDAVRAPAVLAMARRAAITMDRTLSQDEMQRLMQDLASAEAPALTPDGLSVFSVLDVSEIERRFQ